MKRKIILVSRCAWTLFNFRSGLMRSLLSKSWSVLGGGAGGDGFESNVEAIGVPFRDLPIRFHGMNPASDLKFLWSIYRWYVRERPAVVHHFTIKPVIYGSIAARFAGVPRVVNTVTGLGYVFSLPETSILRFLAERLYRLGLSCAHHVCFQNGDDRDLFVQRGLVAFNKTHVMTGSGVDLEKFTPAEAPIGNGVVFLLVGRLLRDKGVHEFVKASKLVKARYPTARFVLLGTRDERNPTVISEPEIEGWKKEGLVEWPGAVDDVREHMARANVVVLPSIYREGVPRSLMEAAARARPIITTDAIGCREVVEEGGNGLLVPVRNPEKLAAAMIWMIEHPEERVRMGKAGRLKMEKEFDERFVIEKTLRLYESP